jgi:2-polyprenyl-3-methyl-5-hydroxy-6-metoxy-1,4-benzoquinol methylase
MTLFYLDSTLAKYNKSKIDFWNKISDSDRLNQMISRYYHTIINSNYQFFIPKKQRILEIGCAQGDLLNALQPSYGVGIDFSSSMINAAKKKYPYLIFHEKEAHDFDIEGTFDFIILSDLVNDLYDVQLLFKNLKKYCKPSTRIIMNFYSHLWEIPLKTASNLKLRNSMSDQNWLTKEDIQNLLELENFEVINRKNEVLFPVYIPVLSAFANKFVTKIWPFKHFALTNFIVAKPRNCEEDKKENLSVSIIVAARNEEGHIDQILDRIPEMGTFTEIIFVEGNSTDNTYAKIEDSIKRFPQDKCSLYKQTGKGKGDAVRLGFEKAKGDILMILDADITVPPEILPRFYSAIAEGKGEFINGVRLVYPMEENAMRFFNLLGNKFFSFAFSWLLGQKIKDTLCGTKVLRKSDYEKIAANRAYFGDFDPFGDFDLLFGAAKMNLKLVDLPVRYGQRTYGTTNIQRWSHGWLLLKMVVFAARRIKFI